MDRTIEMFIEEKAVAFALGAIYKEYSQANICTQIQNLGVEIKIYGREGGPVRRVVMKGRQLPLKNAVVIWQKLYELIADPWLVSEVTVEEGVELPGITPTKFKQGHSVRAFFDLKTFNINNYVILLRPIKKNAV